MTQETAHSAEHTKKKRSPSKGEALFDLGVYGGMNYIGTFLLTIPVAYSMKSGLLKKYYDAAHGWLTQKGVSKGMAEKVLDTTVLMQGGNIMLAPIMLAEANKKDIVKGINESLGDHVDPHAIEEAPQQDWWSLIKSRALAWGVVFVSLTTAAWAAGKDKEGVPRFDKFSEWVGQKAADIFKKPAYRAGVETRTFAYGKIAAIDAFATLAAVSMLYMGTRIFGKKADGSVDGASIKAPTRIAVHKEPRQEKDDTPVSGKFAERLTQEKADLAVESRAI